MGSLINRRIGRALHEQRNMQSWRKLHVDESLCTMQFFVCRMLRKTTIVIFSVATMLRVLRTYRNVVLLLKLALHEIHDVHFAGMSLFVTFFGGGSALRRLGVTGTPGTPRTPAALHPQRQNPRSCRFYEIAVQIENLC